MKDPVRGYVSLFVVVVVIGCLAGAGTGCTMPRPEKNVRNPDPSGKIPAYKEAVREHDRRAVPQMVKDLSSDDPAVRMFAIVALRRLTNGDTFGYQYFDDEHQRRPAVKRWETWLASQQQKKPGGGGDDDDEPHNPQQQDATAGDGNASAADAPKSASGR